MKLDLNERDQKYINAFWALEGVHDCSPDSADELSEVEKRDLFAFFDIFDDTDRSEFEIRDIALKNDPDLERRGLDAFKRYAEITKMKF